LTEDEAAYLRGRLPKCTVRLRARHTARPRQLDHLGPILVASIYCHEDYFGKIVPFLHWAATTGRRVISRPHPREDPTAWQRPEVRGLAELQSSQDSFIEHLARLRPRVVVSWFSTALVDALRVGVIPVTICGDDDPNVANMVYPLFRRSLRWPKDTALIEHILSDNDAYDQALQGLQQ